jgi:hypothetical protein
MDVYENPGNEAFIFRQILEKAGFLRFRKKVIILHPFSFITYKWAIHEYKMRNSLILPKYQNNKSNDVTIYAAMTNYCRISLEITQI